MGAWGPGLFQDDTACDVRDDFVDLIGDGLSTEEATAELEKRWGTPSFDPDHESVFWIALATTQFRYGRLLPHVRDCAVAVIDEGSDVERFFDDGRTREKRSAALFKLRRALLGPQRRPRIIRKEPVHATPHDIGAILAYRLISGQTCLWRVVGHHIGKGGRFARIELLSGLHETMPSELRLAFMSGLRERKGRFFEMMLMPWDEASDRLSSTGRGGSLLATALEGLRRAARAQAPRVCIIPVKRSLDQYLLDKFGMS